MAFSGLPVRGQVIDANGNPISGALVNFKKEDTTTDQAAYTDRALATPAANPIVSDSAGQWLAYLDPDLTYYIEPTSEDGATAYNPFYVGGADTDVSAAERTRLQAAQTYYVRSDGSDTNTGLSDNSDGAFQTLQKAADTIAQTLDLNGYDVNVYVRAGTYTSGVSVQGAWAGEDLVYFLRDESTPANVLISTTSANCFLAQYGARFAVRGFKMQTATSGHCLVSYNGGLITQQSNDFGACAQMHHEVGTFGTILPDGPYAISGGAQGHWHVGSDGLISTSTFLVTISNTPAFSSYFAGVSNGRIRCGGVTYTGTGATGQRFFAHANGVIYTTQGLTSLPGDSDGKTETGGLYRGDQDNVPYYLRPGNSGSGDLRIQSMHFNDQAYTDRFRVTSETFGGKGYFYVNGDDCYSSGRTHFSGSSTVSVASGTTDGWTFREAGFGILAEASANGASVIGMRRRTSIGDIQVFYNDATFSGSISVNGAATAYNTSSDLRLKEKVELLSADDAWDIVNNLDIWRFLWKYVKGQPQAVGLMAQEAYAVSADLASPGDNNPDLKPGDEGFDPWGVDQSKPMPYVLVILQDIFKRLLALEDERGVAPDPVASLEALKDKLDAREAKPDKPPAEISDLFESDAYGMEADRLFKLHTDLTSKIVGNMPVSAAERALHSRLTPHVPWLKSRGAVEVL